MLLSRGQASVLLPGPGPWLGRSDKLLHKLGDTRTTKKHIYRSEYTVSHATDPKKPAEFYTMSQIYVKDRPAPIPMEEHESRRKRRELQEISEAASRRGIAREAVASKLQQMDTILPGLVDLHKAKASDWVTIINDIDLVATKLVILKSYFPGANMLKILTAQPRILLSSPEVLKANAEEVRTMLEPLENIGAILDMVPDMMFPRSVALSLQAVKVSFPGEDPFKIIAKHPDFLLNLGESSMEDSAEYGELSTKD